MSVIKRIEKCPECGGHIPKSWVKMHAFCDVCKRQWWVRMIRSKQTHFYHQPQKEVKSDS
jgi:competence CoiA-like predicted nuclease